jgi:membrane protease YdiL (CAAX protease family)
MNEELQNQENQNKEDPHEEIKPFSTISPILTAFIALFGIFFLYQVGGALLTIAIFGFNIEKADINAVRLLTTGGQLLLILLPTLIIARLVYHNNTTFMLRVKFPKAKEVGAFVIGLIILTPLLQNILYVQNYVLQKLAENSLLVKNLIRLMDELDKLVEKTYGNLLSAHSIFEASFVIFIVAVIPALCEETLFRGLVQKSLERKLKPFWSIFITASFFGLYHFNPYGLVALIALGAYFGYAAYVSDSIFVTMILHFLNNLVAVLAYFLFGNDELINTGITKSDHIVPQLFSLVMFATLFFSYMIFIKTNYNKFILNNKRSQT